MMMKKFIQLSINPVDKWLDKFIEGNWDCRCKIVGTTDFQGDDDEIY